MNVNQARVVVIGSGIAGSSIALHLAELGWTDVVVLDQGPLIGGTTSHAPGLVGQLRSSVSLTKMLMHSVALYKTLKVAGEPGYFEVGSLRLASSPERMVELKRQYGFAKAVGLDCELISAAEARQRFPLMDLAGVEGALYLPSDGSARAPILARAMAERAAKLGVRFIERRPVTGFELANGKLEGVKTSDGMILCEQAVIACGIWSPVVAAMAGIQVPLLPMQHQYVLTGKVPGLATGRPLPNLRDPDKLVYFRQDGEGMVVGGYEREPAPFELKDIRDPANPTVVDYYPPRFDALWKAAVERVPAVQDAGFVKKVNGLESFTPDGEFILGPAPQVRGLWLACGFNAHGVSGSGGVGKMLAEWIVEGEPSLDLWHMDLRRFGGFASDRFVSERVREVYGTYYDIFYPGQERGSARNLRVSPLHSRTTALGAVFGEKAGWERPLYYVPNEDAGKGFERPKGWAGRNWSPAIAVEHRACRERAAIFDVSSFSKLEADGPGALAFLQRLSANDVDRPVGSVTYTQLLNHRGGIESDLTITRLSADKFWIVTGSAFGTHDQAWLSSHLPDDRSVRLTDRTLDFGCVGLWGPRSREILASVCADDLSNQGFPFYASRQLSIAGANVLALRVTYCGELGWELYVENGQAGAVWDAIYKAGLPYGLVPAGYRCIETMRLEKGYRYWSAEIHSEYHPYEAGLGFAVKLDKGDFIGRKALEAAKAAGLKRKLCALVLDAGATTPLGGEPVLSGGEVVGRVTSGGYGWTLNANIAYCYLPTRLREPGTKVEVLISGEKTAATVTKEPLYDPLGAKIKA